MRELAIAHRDPEFADSNFRQSRPDMQILGLASSETHAAFLTSPGLRSRSSAFATAPRKTVNLFSWRRRARFLAPNRKINPTKPTTAPTASTINTGRRGSKRRSVIVFGPLQAAVRSTVNTACPHATPPARHPTLWYVIAAPRASWQMSTESRERRSRSCEVARTGNGPSDPRWKPRPPGTLDSTLPTRRPTPPPPAPRRSATLSQRRRNSLPASRRLPAGTRNVSPSYALRVPPDRRRCLRRCLCSAAVRSRSKSAKSGIPLSSPHPRDHKCFSSITPIALLGYTIRSIFFAVPTAVTWGRVGSHGLHHARRRLRSRSPGKSAAVKRVKVSMGLPIDARKPWVTAASLRGSRSRRTSR